MKENCKMQVLNDEKYKVEVAKDVTIPTISNPTIEIEDKDNNSLKETDYGEKDKRK